MKQAGWVLVILQALGVVSSLITGRFFEMFAAGASAHGAGTLLGFFLPGIIGVILLLKSNKSSNKE